MRKSLHFKSLILSVFMIGSASLNFNIYGAAGNNISKSLVTAPVVVSNENGEFVLQKRTPAIVWAGIGASFSGLTTLTCTSNIMAHYTDYMEKFKSGISIKEDDYLTLYMGVNFMSVIFAVPFLIGKSYKLFSYLKEPRYNKQI
ncbi:MAG: hypothetical protein RsTaC01_0838 [Candidatus Paraimprobicoccus trichonymphae]|uniref:Uncharacterized protein n=1 Tax=Candidatus Paraimprobicoccus trichonymphae TaxID=3033793 RepID=A0AA48IHI5_9FIRM|nr:MAG: hypothetical protein RsTaC01_0838 [Candidatus Paraimprobicoccus trichonymphae]